MIEVNGSDTDFKGWKFPHSSMIPENYIFIDNTLDDAINNTENTSGTSAGNSIQNPTDVENMQDCATPLNESSAERAQLQNEINKFSAS